MTSCSDVIHDITRHMCQAIKQLGATSVRTHWSNSCWEVHVHAWIDALVRPRWESLLPSNIADWVVLVCPHASAFIDVPYNTLRTARECRVLPKEYHLHRTVVPFGWCPCALFIELLFTSLETQCRHGDLHHFCTAHVTHIWNLCTWGEGWSGCPLVTPKSYCPAGALVNFFDTCQEYILRLW